MNPEQQIRILKALGWKVEAQDGYACENYNALLNADGDTIADDSPAKWDKPHRPVYSQRCEITRCSFCTSLWGAPIHTIPKDYLWRFAPDPLKSYRVCFEEILPHMESLAWYITIDRHKDSGEWYAWFWQRKEDKERDGPDATASTVTEAIATAFDQYLQAQEKNK